MCRLPLLTYSLCSNSMSSSLKSWNTKPVALPDTSPGIRTTASTTKCSKTRAKLARSHAAVLFDHLQQFSVEELRIRQQAADRAMVRLGITFNVYGDERGTERTIPFDIIPRILDSKEWQWIDRGLKQRILRSICSSTISTIASKSLKTALSPITSFCPHPRFGSSVSA